MPSAVVAENMSSVGNHIVVIIADETVKRLGINDDSTYVQEEVTDNGILLRVKHFVKEVLYTILHVYCLLIWYLPT